MLKKLLTILILTSGCSGSQPHKIPKNLEQIENLLIYDETLKPHKEILFTREITFSENEKTFWGGYIKQIEVDNRGRVYIADVDESKIHIYEPGGKLLQSIGGQGAGPGEFQMIWFIHVGESNLYVLDYIQHKFSTFSLETLNHVEDFHISISDSEKTKPSWINWTRNEGLMYVPLHMYEKSDDNLLIFFGDQTVGAIDNNDLRTLEASFYNPDTGVFSKHDVLSLRADGTALYSDDFILSDVPYKPRAHVDYNGEKLVYAFSDELLFKVYDGTGKYKMAFYYPFQNTGFNIDVLISMFEIEAEYINSIQQDAPEAWPAFHSFILDDENRLWVSTIVEDFDVYEWRVLEETGELITRFDWPRDEPIEAIKNGYIYTREMDEETGLQQVVRYQIDMK